MSDKNIQEQLDAVNHKLDMILEESAMQKQNREAVVDLVDDLSLVGKDAFKGMISDLDDAGIELDSDALSHMLLGFIRNLNNINVLLQTLESVTDLLKDVSPIIKQVGVDAVDKFKEIDEKGYFEILRQITLALDTIMAKYSKEDLKSLSDNIIITMDTMIGITDPVIMKKANKAVSIMKDIDIENIEKYSLWKLMRQMNKPEIKQSLGFMLTFMKRFMNEN